MVISKLLISSDLYNTRITPPPHTHTHARARARTSTCAQKRGSGHDLQRSTGTNSEPLSSFFMADLLQRSISIDFAAGYSFAGAFLQLPLSAESFCRGVLFVSWILAGLDASDCSEIHVHALEQGKPLLIHNLI
jgi:hypothetical protein